MNRLTDALYMVKFKVSWRYLNSLISGTSPREKKLYTSLRKRKMQNQPPQILSSEYHCSFILPVQPLCSLTLQTLVYLPIVSRCLPRLCWPQWSFRGFAFPEVLEIKSSVTLQAHQNKSWILAWTSWSCLSKLFLLQSSEGTTFMGS